MKKSAGIAVGALVAVAAIGTGGAWYTGQQLPAVLDASIKQANAEMAKTLPALGLDASIELLSLDRQFFSSNARYRIKFNGSVDGGAPQQLEWVITDRIEHGPFPMSRLKALKLMPVMATSNYALESNPGLEKWFAASKGVSPVEGQASLGYDQSVSGTLRINPLQSALDEDTSLDFTGLNVDFDTSAGAKAIEAQGLMDSFKLSTKLPESGEVMNIEFKGMTLDSQTAKGSSDFYLGKNEVKLQTVQIQVGEGAPVQLSGFVQRDETSETDGKLFARYSYDIGMISYQGHDIGGSQMVWSMKNLDASALQSLIGIYSQIIKDSGQLQQASLEAEDDLPQLSEEQQAQLMADLDKLLAAKPGIALEKLAFKTANGESSLSLSVDLNKPESFELPPPELAKQMIAQLDAKVSVSKAMIGDVIGLQASLGGETDKEAVAQQASMMTEMASGMALSTELARLEGDSIVSTLRYADDKVDFNGKQMTVEEFVAMAFASGAGMGGMGAMGEEEQSMEGLEFEEQSEETLVE
ncbi:YdgA family protein [Pseudomonas sp. Gutcm_11s]|uniref:YdgA family protein n=1 Tax=Pseudomonas sp. Gutcm_11s TaxID=3026088 RepID=UPI00236318B3|nr:YdgA family protein [Pseudomonas sp. Gutcm_11s]MDD0843664.1 YdgA family protein [Pseudomonas sp. Gutcm_11s]